MTLKTGDDWTDEELDGLFMRVSNVGRWGADDELGTLNFITPHKRRSAAALVQDGKVVSMAHPLRIRATAARPQQVDHRMLYWNVPDNPLRGPPSAGDYLGLEIHQHGLTHLDSVSHIGSRHGRAYNDRAFDDVATEEGLRHGSVFAQRDGIVSRGVLLDVAAALGVDWLESDHLITAGQLEVAERHGRVHVGRGDVLVVRVGAEARADACGPSPLGSGPGPDAVAWLHEREVAVYAGDAPEHLAEAGARILGLLPADSHHDAASSTTGFPLLLHQIGIPAMGLVLLDYCRVEELAGVCAETGRYEFLFTAAPLALPGGTGSPVNPLAIF
ncbi:MAG: cyclase family protein [Mycobacteriales bacterium]